MSVSYANYSASKNHQIHVLKPGRYQYDYSAPEPVKVVNTPPRVQMSKPKSRILSYTIPLDSYTQLRQQSQSPLSSGTHTTHPENSTNEGHVLGVNSIFVSDIPQDINLNEQCGIDDNTCFENLMFTAGRDGAVKMWGLGKDYENKKVIAFIYSHVLHVISGSSDSGIRLWTPFDNEGSSTISHIGSHEDYIKTLKFCEDSQRLISGGLDSYIHVWDVNRDGKMNQTGNPVQSLGLDSSIYALDCNCAGTVVAYATTDKTVGLWDLRSKASTGTLVGHTDRVNTVLLSKDGELLLTGSSDKSVKLWSIKNKRCIATYSLHASSVWSLMSLDPRLEVFYSGDKEGNIMKTKTFEELDISLALGKEKYGVLQIASQGDCVWTATNGPELNCWRDSNDINRLEAHGTGIHTEIYKEPSAAFEKPDVYNVPEDEEAEIKENEVVDSKSGKSEPELDAKSETKSQVIGTPEHRDGTKPILSIHGPPGIRKYVMLQNKRQALAVDAKGVISLWDLIEARCIKIFGSQWGADLDLLADSLNQPVQRLPTWCTLDTKLGRLTVSINLSKNTNVDTEVYLDQLDNIDHEAKEKMLNAGYERIYLLPWVIKCLFNNCVFQKNSIETVSSLSEWVLKNPLGDQSTVSEIQKAYTGSSLYPHLFDYTVDLATVPTEAQLALITEAQAAKTQNSSESSEGKGSAKSFFSKIFGFKQKKKVQKQTSPPNHNGNAAKQPGFADTFGKKSASPTATASKNIKGTAAPQGNSLNTNTNANASVNTDANADADTYVVLPSNQNSSLHRSEKPVYKNIVELEMIERVARSICEPQNPPYALNSAHSPTTRAIAMYPIHPMPQNIEIAVYQTYTLNSVIPKCIYFAPLSNLTTKLPIFAKHIVSDSPYFTLALSFSSWTHEILLHNRLSYFFTSSPKLNFTLRPYPSPLQLPVLDHKYNVLSSHQMLRVLKVSEYIFTVLEHAPFPLAYLTSLAAHLLAAVSAVIENKNTITSEDCITLDLSLDLDDSTTKETDVSSTDSNGNKDENCIYEFLLEQLENKILLGERLALRSLSDISDFPLTAVLYKHIKVTKISNSSLNSAPPDAYTLEILDHTNLVSTLSSFSLSKSLSTFYKTSITATGSKNTTLEQQSVPQPDVPVSASSSSSDPVTLSEAHKACLYKISYLFVDFFCKDLLIEDPLTTLLTIKSHIWKSNQDIVLQYKWKPFISDRINRR
ncbi:UBP9-binding protein [Zancudomyces culisetae]|uniref:UBP9-binding protein n=1 Tax=Zancudomyces culisetae TaxID=1213189 RepID=A0A1R1PL23_ZANCU|nr:UBP9-binding protein [Zancudomyces culisetae]|eukprot:OMH81623.1 UBP9-binding protein [Zancudomyces culisetae]